MRARDLALDGRRDAENVTFGFSRSFSGLGDGDHTLRIERQTGVVYVDGFSFACGGGPV